MFETYIHTIGLLITAHGCSKSRNLNFKIHSIKRVDTGDR